MSWIEHSPAAASRSDVVLGSVKFGLHSGKLLLTVFRPVQEALPWLRTGAPVSVVLGEGRDAGLMRVQRDGPHRLLGPGRVLDRIPPVMLRMEPLPWMRADAPNAEEAVSYELVEQNRCLQIRLPAWAAPPAAPSGTLTAYAGLFTGPGARP